MPDYSQGKIYRLTCIILGLVYYGSTVLSLKQRLIKHKCDYNRWKSGKSTKYCASFELFEAGDIEIELVMDCPCESKRELEEVEQTFIENDDCVNLHNSYESIEKYKERKKKQLQEYELTDKRKEYLLNYNKSEKRKESYKRYREKKKLQTIKTIE